MSSLPARMRMIDSKMKELECSQDFSNYKSGDFSRSSRAANSAVLGPIISNFKLGRDFMVVLLTCKNEEDRIKNRGAGVFTTFYINFSDAQGQITLELVAVSGRNLNSSKLSCMSSLPERMRIEAARVFTRFLPLQVYGDFFRRSRAANSAVLSPIWPNFELVRDFMYVLVTCKYEEDPIKNEGARVFTTFSPI